MSKVANFSLDLPEATIAIQVSGSFGSRQEEAQRLGRILRPKKDGRGARFYTVVSRDTVDADFAAHRQRFLAEQGYAYRIVDADGRPRRPGGLSPAVGPRQLRKALRSGRRKVPCRQRLARLCEEDLLGAPIAGVGVRG